MIDWNNLSLELMTAELVEQIKEAYGDLLTEKRAIVASKADILNDLKKAKKQYTEFESLLGEAEVTDLAALKDLVIKGKASIDPDNDVAKTIEQYRQQRIEDGIAHRKALDQARSEAEVVKLAIQADKDSLNEKYRESIIRSKLSQATSADFTVTDDAYVGLRRQGFSVRLQDNGEGDDRPFEERDIVLYKSDKSIPYTLNDGIEQVKKEYPHYLRSTFAGGSGQDNRKGSAAAGNPYVDGTRTQQVVLEMRDPAKAKQLQEAAAAAKK